MSSTDLHFVGVRVDGVPLLQLGYLVLHVEAGTDARLAALVEVVVSRLWDRNTHCQLHVSTEHLPSAITPYDSQ